MDDEFLHLNTANGAHQHRIQNTPKNVFVEVHHWIALSLMGDSMRHFLWGRRPDDWFVTDQHPRGLTRLIVMVRDIVPEGVTRIVLNANVKNIDWSDHVTVLTHDRRKWTIKHAISTASFGVLQKHRNTSSRLTYPEAHVLFDEQWYSHGTLDARSDSVPNSVVGQFVSSLTLGIGRRSSECREFRIHELGDSCL